ADNVSGNIAVDSPELRKPLTSWLPDQASATIWKAQSTGPANPVPILAVLKEAPKRVAVKLSRATLSQYVGIYTLPSGADLIVTPNARVRLAIPLPGAKHANIVITNSGDQLQWELPGVPPVPLFAESDSTFFTTVFESQLKFHRDPQDQTLHMTL